jgi:adenine deaminase
VPDWVRNTVRIGAMSTNEFAIPWEGDGQARVIGLVPDQIVTESLVDTPRVEGGKVLADPDRDLLKIAVIERHLGTGRVGLGLVRGFGLRSGAIASTVAHDAHNLVVVGVKDDDMLRAVRRLTDTGGGVVVVDSGIVRAELKLPVAGLLSDASLEDVIEGSNRCVEAARELGCELASPFQSMAILALSVIPSLKITDRGLVDVDRFELVPLQV